MKAAYTIDDLRAWESAVAAEPVRPRLGVFGDPVLHSRSPQMHNPALEQCGIDARYVRLHIGEPDFAEAIRLLAPSGFLGANVTIPHKAAALRAVDDADPVARRMGAVNTVVVEGDRLAGFSTDGPGFVRALREDFSVDLRDLRVLVLGAGGGAGRSIAVQCAIERCERLVLVNRTPEKAVELARELAPDFRGGRLEGPTARLVAVPWDEAHLRRELDQVDLVVNATSVGMRRTDPAVLPPGLLRAFHLVYDTVYAGSGPTPLLSAAAEAGARGANGLSMLLHQGALSFEIWFNRPAPLEAMRKGLMAA